MDYWYQGESLIWGGGKGHEADRTREKTKKKKEKTSGHIFAHKGGGKAGAEGLFLGGMPKRHEEMLEEEEGHRGIGIFLDLGETLGDHGLGVRFKKH